MKSAFNLIRPVGRSSYENKTSHVFSGPGPFYVGQRIVRSKIDYKNQVEDFLREAGITEYTVSPVAKRGDFNQMMSGYEFRFKHPEDLENLLVCFIGNSQNGHSNTTLGLDEHQKNQIDTYVTALRKFMDKCGFDYQITEIDRSKGSIKMTIDGDVNGHVVVRAHRGGYIERMFMHENDNSPDISQIRKGLNFNI